jgi:hypothetical protein
MASRFVLLVAGELIEQSRACGPSGCVAGSPSLPRAQLGRIGRARARGETKGKHPTSCPPPTAPPCFLSLPRRRSRSRLPQTFSLQHHTYSGAGRGPAGGGPGASLLRVRARARRQKGGRWRWGRGRHLSPPTSLEQEATTMGPIIVVASLLSPIGPSSVAPAWPPCGALHARRPTTKPNTRRQRPPPTPPSLTRKRHPLKPKP